MRRKCLIFLLLLAPVYLSASQLPDSILQQVAPLSPSARCTSLLELANSSLNANPSLSEELAQAAFETAKDTDDLENMAHAQLALGMALAKQDSSILAMRHYRKANEWLNMLLDQRPTVERKKLASQCNLKMGFQYLLSFSDNNAAQTHFIRALNFAEQAGDANLIAASLTGLGYTYRVTGSYYEAMDLYQRVILMADELTDTSRLVVSNNEIGNLYLYLENYEKSIEYHQVALKLAMKTANKYDEAFVLHDIGILFHMTGEYEKALEYFDKHLELIKGSGQKRDILLNLNNLTDLYLEMNRLTDAKTTMNDAKEIAKSFNVPADVLQELYLTWSEVHEGIGEYRQALDYLVQYETIHDSLFSYQKNLQFQELQMRYRSEEMEKELAILQYREQLMWFSIFGGVIIIALVSLLLVYRYRAKVRAHRETEERHRQLAGLYKQLENAMHARIISEQRFKDVAMSSADLIWETDSEFTFSFLSGNVTELTGYDTNALQGSDFSRIMTTENWAHVKTSFQNVLQTGDSLDNLDIECQLPSGESKIFRLHAVAMRGMNGKINGLRGLAKDITKQRALEEQLLQARQLEIATQLATTVAHEFNNPMAIIQGAVDLARMNNVSQEEATQWMFDHIPKQVKRMKELVDKLLKIEHIEAKDYAAGIKMLDLDNRTDIKETDSANNS